MRVLQILHRTRRLVTHRGIIFATFALTLRPLQIVSFSVLPTQFCSSSAPCTLCDRLPKVAVNKYGAKLN